MNKVTRALAAPLLAAACGTGTDGKPVTPPTTPEPVPAGPPVVRAVAELWSQPDDDGYSVGDRIRVVLEFDPLTTTVEGSPRLAIEIGNNVRLADFSPWIEDDFPPERPSFLQRFDYEVRAGDEDADGISIHADALDFSEGAFLNTAGVEIEVEITAVAPERDSPNPVEPGEALDTHRVLGQPEPRECTDERRRAMRYSRWVRGWNGTPFQVDMIRNFPDVATEEDVAILLDAVTHLDEKIEDQLGYRILEMGEVIPIPKGAPLGWNKDEQEYRRTCPVKAKRGQIVGFYMDDTNHGSRTSDAQANSACGSISYLQPFLTYWPCRGCEDARTSYRHFVDGVTLHEIFHVLGFVHFDDDDFLDRGDGVPMTRELTWAQGPDAEAVLWNDIDLLRCIFPESG